MLLQDYATSTLCQPPVRWRVTSGATLVRFLLTCFMIKYIDSMSAGVPQLNKQYYWAVRGLHGSNVIPSSEDLEPPSTMPTRESGDETRAKRLLSKSTRKKILLAFRERSLPSCSTPLVNGQRSLNFLPARICIASSILLVLALLGSTILRSDVSD